ncbi:DUF7691 family protein [Phytomonospora endophytica]|uniref:DUF7691 domain-containing protein n=1 Tax=Phytomonospora endophytica TaxID=714109 RepID=A0A841FUS0_9ACTN|nr:hypothetical protein [Phytomonospora endophytica]MBB6038503.1 hypothetical protein [Phytomonospora endophytica]GIG64433.1 hypothetical protein Pen01_07280 [Phytomonospora endophytica]
MGYGVMAYSVDIDKLVALCGSGDDRMRRVISGKSRESIYRTNDQLGLSNERGEPSVFTAINHLILGEEMTLEGYMYGYAFKYIVEFSGRFLSNGPFYPCSSDYLSDTVDAELAEVGASVRMTDLIWDGAPVSFPRPDDFPMIGHWTAEQVAASVEPVRAGTSEELKTIGTWLDQSAAQGRGIVGFYH